jgi:hypothetical protein
MKPRPKARIDAWDAPLKEADRWNAYAKFQVSSWQDVSKWIGETFAIRPPGRASLYRWARRMREMESAHRIEQAITARDEAGALAAAACPDDPALIAAYKALAADLALRNGDAAAAAAFTKMALDIAAQQTKSAELALKSRAQGTKDETLRLARQKFEAAEARIAKIRDAVGEARNRGGLTPETLKKIEEAAGLL